jgi:hypothetical protein
MKEITLDYERFEELIRQENELYALKQAGVEQWEGYPTAMGIYQEITN